MATRVPALSVVVPIGDEASPRVTHTFSCADVLKAVGYDTSILSKFVQIANDSMTLHAATHEPLLGERTSVTLDQLCPPSTGTSDDETLETLEVKRKRDELDEGSLLFGRNVETKFIPTSPAYSPTSPAYSPTLTSPQHAS